MYTRALGATDWFAEVAEHNAEEAKANQQTAKQGGGWEDFFKNLIGGVATEWVKGKNSSGKTVYVQQQSSMPSWLPYVLIGGGVVVVAVLLKSRA